MKRIKDLIKLVRLKLEYDTLGYYRNMITIGNNTNLLNSLHKVCHDKVNIFHMQFSNSSEIPKETIKIDEKERQNNNDIISDSLNKDYIYKILNNSEKLLDQEKIHQLREGLDNQFDGLIFTPFETFQGMLFF